MEAPISIIIIADCYANALERNLPGVLAQQYDFGFEVVVVRESRKGETYDILTPLMTEHKNLSSTYIPDKPQYISDAEVALMLGVKAAKHEKIVIIHPSFEVPSENWLRDLSTELNGKLTIGQPYFHKKQNFISKLLRKRKSLSILQPWLEVNSIEPSSIKIDKKKRNLLTLSFNRSDYLSDDTLRYFIYKYSNP